MAAGICLGDLRKSTKKKSGKSVFQMST